jgi:hypothetical protein
MNTMRIHAKWTLFIAGVSCGWASYPAFGQHAADMWVGSSGGSVALSTSGLVPGMVYSPLIRVDTFLHGWSNNNPGFDHVVGAQGGAGPLSSSAQIRLEVVSLDPALYVIDNSFTLLDSPGDRTLLGGSTLHTHLTWFVDDTDPGFGAELCVWEGRFRLVDTGSGLAPSLPFSLYFTNAPVRGGEFPPTPTEANGDFDMDHDVDRIDQRAFAVCFSGPQVIPQPGNPAVTTCEVDCHNAFDFDDDLDVDLLDFAEWQVHFGH